MQDELTQQHASGIVYAVLALDEAAKPGGVCTVLVHANPTPDNYVVTVDSTFEIPPSSQQRIVKAFDSMARTVEVKFVVTPFSNQI